MLHTDKLDVIEVVNKLFVFTDSRSWDKIQSEVFAEDVYFDMSSLGGEISMMTSKQICELWNEGFKRIDSVNHLAGNYIVNINNDKAVVFAYATATHYKESASNGKTREFVGTYDIELILLDNGWRINKFKYNLKFMTGNQTLT
jgi:hypothetical protein